MKNKSIIKLEPGNEKMKGTITKTESRGLTKFRFYQNYSTEPHNLSHSPTCGDMGVVFKITMLAFSKTLLFLRHQGGIWGSFVFDLLA